MQKAQALERVLHPRETQRPSNLSPSLRLACAPRGALLPHPLQTPPHVLEGHVYHPQRLPASDLQKYSLAVMTIFPPPPPPPLPVQSTKPLTYWCHPLGVAWSSCPSLTASAILLSITHSGRWWRWDQPLPCEVCLVLCRHRELMWPPYPRPELHSRVLLENQNHINMASSFTLPPSCLHFRAKFHDDTKPQTAPICRFLICVQI